jgi:hypothetical protein
MVADVQNWLDHPANDFGWLVHGNEAATGSAKRFASKENSISTERPTLTIDYTSPLAASTLLVSGFPSSVTAGVPGMVTVTAKDAMGHTVPGYRGTVHFTSTDPRAVLPADYTFTAADAGVHSFRVTLTTTGAQSITVTDTASGSVTGTQTGITVSPGAPDHISFNEPATVTAGVPFLITVTVQDAYNNTVTGYTGMVHFTATSGAMANYTFQPADIGQHTFTITLRQAGPLGVTGTDMVTGISGMTSFTIVPAAADHLVFLQPPSTTPAGQILSPVVVAVVDQFGNVETGDNSDVVTLSLSTNPGGGTLSGTLTLTVSGGLATFSDLSINLPGVGYTLHAHVGGGLADIDSNPFTITM